ncbi:hypothetical protein HNQ80_002797 [Anaerosolibacter carboniphilus]|uniref:Uncharacterized protein n=1 Tax=Anaerosolibacter carboniphilus TaxID=1417629 RepID=A0A841KTH8_9FIRM|nr:hypothetical protein [Anaerosolibacter carboniphilus]
MAPGSTAKIDGCPCGIKLGGRPIGGRCCPGGKPKGGSKGGPNGGRIGAPKGGLKGGNGCCLM